MSPPDNLQQDDLERNSELGNLQPDEPAHSDVEGDSAGEVSEDIADDGEGDEVELTPRVLVWAYCNGLFPMADSREGSVGWYSPDPRAILPLDGLHVRKSLRRVVKKQPFEIRHDQAFRRVMEYCAAPRSYEPGTWISDEIIDVYSALHERGMAHSVEAWTRPDPTPTSQSAPDDSPEVSPNDSPFKPELVGGLYGVSIGGAFFGESMFSLRTDASKVCLVHLVDHLNQQGFTLLDVQFNSDHMSQFGVVEIPRDEYLSQLQQAINLPVMW